MNHACQIGSNPTVHLAAGCLGADECRLLFARTSLIRCLSRLYSAPESCNDDPVLGKYCRLVSMMGEGEEKGGLPFLSSGSLYCLGFNQEQAHRISTWHADNFGMLTILLFGIAAKMPESDAWALTGNSDPSS